MIKEKMLNIRIFRKLWMFRVTEFGNLNEDICEDPSRRTELLHFYVLSVSSTVKRTLLDINLFNPRPNQ